jgi:hypothetical protein
MGKSRWTLSYKEIYNHYNYDSLNYIIDIIYGFYSKYREECKLKGITGGIEEKKIQMIRYEIIAKFCQYAENLGAFTYGYDTHHSSRDKESKILSTLIRYYVSEIEKEYRSLTKGQIHRLWKNQEHALKNIFGYHKITNSHNVYESLLNIKKLLREIYDCYRFYKESYNSYKHGYQLWFGRDQNQIDVAIYVLRRGKRKRRKYVPSDDGSLSVVLKCSHYCRQLFDILIENQRQLAIMGKKKASNKIDILFLKKKNNDFIVQKQSC